jgi:hypothetical protein
MRYFGIFLIVAAWAWFIIVVLIIGGLSILGNGFVEGMRRTSMAILSPTGLYVMTPSLVLGGIGSLIRRHSETDNKG